LTAYVGALSLLAIAGIHSFDPLPAAETTGPAASGCSVTGALLPVVGPFDFS
jgi:hypothetical protein